MKKELRLTTAGFEGFVVVCVGRVRERESGSVFVFSLSLSLYEYMRIFDCFEFFLREREKCF